MTGECIDLIGTFLLKHLGSLAQCAGSINHVVDDDACLALDIADQLHLLNLVGFFALFVKHCEADLALIAVIVEMLVEGFSSAKTTRVWGDHHDLGLVWDFIQEIAQSSKSSLEVVECSARGHISLSLRNVQVY